MTKAEAAKAVEKQISICAAAIKHGDSNVNLVNLAFCMSILEGRLVKLIDNIEAPA